MGMTVFILCYTFPQSKQTAAGYPYWPAAGLGGLNFGGIGGDYRH